jgi:glycosyltransferase involved in cell wall biosynthesis
MKIGHWMKRENSGLVRATLELAHYEERLGNDVYVAEPSTGTIMYGTNGREDIHAIHSQLKPEKFHDGIPKILFMHGEPLCSVSNGVSMKAIVDLAPLCDAFICMRQDELSTWKSIKRATYRISKGVDLDRFKPLDSPPEKLEGNPAVIYTENWRGERNPLYACIAMQIVRQRFPEAVLHLFNCQDQKMFSTFKTLWSHNHWWTFLRTINGPVEDVNALYNRADMVINCNYPLYARGVEAFAANKPLICPGYNEYQYPYQCRLEPQSMANAVIQCYEQGYKIHTQDGMDLTPRQWAETHHNAETSAKEALAIYEKYVE